MASAAAPLRYAALSTSSLGMLIQSFQEYGDAPLAGVGSWGRVVVDDTSRNGTPSASLVLPFPLCDGGANSNGSLPAGERTGEATNVAVVHEAQLRRDAQCFRHAPHGSTILLLQCSTLTDGDGCADLFRGVDDGPSAALRALCSRLLTDLQAAPDTLATTSPDAPMRSGPSTVMVSFASSTGRSSTGTTGCCSKMPRGSSTIDLFDDVVSFDAVDGPECKEYLASVVFPSLADTGHHQHGGSGMSYLVLEVEDVASRKRLCIGLFDVRIGAPNHAILNDSAGLLSDGRFERGLAHCASMAQRPSGLVVLDTPTADLESSNVDASADVVLQSMVLQRLMCAPQLVDSVVTVARPMTAAVRLAVHSETDALGGLAAFTSSLKSLWHKALQRRLIEMDLNDAASEVLMFDTEQCHNTYIVLCNVVESLLLPWIATGRAPQHLEHHDTAASPGIVAGVPTAAIDDSAVDIVADAHSLELNDVSPIARGTTTLGAAREQSEATLDSGSPLLSDLSIALQAPRPLQGTTIASDATTDADNNKQPHHKVPIVLSPSAASAVDSLDVAMGRGGLAHHSRTGDEAPLVASARSDTLDVIVPSPDPQRGQSLFRFDDSFALSPLRATGVTTDSVLMCEHLREEVRVLKAAVEVVENEKRDADSLSQTTIESLQAQLLAEQQASKRWKCEAQRYRSLAHGSALLIPGTTIETSGSPLLPDGGKAPSEGSQGSLSVSLYPDTPKTPFDANRSVSSPRELRAARKARQSVSNPRVFGSPQLALNNRSLISVPWSDATSTPRAVSLTNFSNLSLVGGYPPDGVLATSVSRLSHAQALRRALVEAVEAKEARELALTWAQDAVRLSHIFVKRTLKRFHDSVEVALNTQHRLAMEGMERNLEACEAALRTTEPSGASQTSAAMPVTPSSSPSAIPNEALQCDVPLHDGDDSNSTNKVFLPNLSMTSSLPHCSPKPLPPAFSMPASSDPFATPPNKRKSLGSVSQGSRSTVRHRLNVATPGTVMVQSRPEVAQAVIMAGRNTKGEERKAAGERVPNLRFDQIRTEAVSWKQHQLDEYKAFTAHQVLFFGDSHVGKSSVVACLTNKVPVLFKKPPQVVTPTLDVHRTRATVHLTRALGSSASVPLGGVPRLTMSEALRLARESASAREPATLPASATTCTVPVSLTEFPTSILRARGASHCIPRRGAISCIVFRLTDDVEVSRQAILRYVQHMLALAAADVDSMHGEPTTSRGRPSATGTPSAVAHTIPFVLIGTHADQVDALHSNDQDMTVAQNILGSYRRWLEDEFAALHHSSSNTMHPLVLDTFAVSCASWTVYGERPKSADSFLDMLNDWCTYLVLHAPTAPEHLLPSWKTLVTLADLEGPFSDDEGPEEEDASGLTSSFAGKAEVAPVMVDYVWARRGGGSQSGGLFSSTRLTRGAAANARPTSLWSRNSGGPGGGASNRDEAAQRWLHGAAMGLITLFTALHRFMEFTGYILDAQMFDNIVLQHLELASRVDEERQLSTRLLRIRDILVEALLVECKQRGFFGRLVVTDITAVAPATQVVVLGSSWFDSVLVPLMMPYTIQVASTMPTSAPAVRRQFAGVGPRHVVTLLQRAAALGVDLTSGAIPMELKSYRLGHVSRKLLFHLLPTPMNTIAATQRNATAFLSALNITEAFSLPGDADSHRGGTPSTTTGSGSAQGTPATPANGSFSPQTIMLHSASSLSSIFIPCVASPVDGRIVHCLDDVLHLMAEGVAGATLQVEMPSMDFFPTVQSRLYNQAVAQWDVAANPATFCGFASKNCFALTATSVSWLLVVAVGGTESDCTFTEYRVVVAHHSPALLPDEADQHATDEQVFQQVLSAFHGGGHAAGSLLGGTTVTEGPVAEKRLVESWDASEDRLGIRQETTDAAAPLGTDVAWEQPLPFAKDLCVQLRGMLERTQRPCLRTVLRLFHLLP